MSQVAEFVAAKAKEFDIPGVAVGVLVDGEETFTSHGVTSVDNPQPVDEKTLFHLASVTKTFTATLLVRLADEGRVDLDAPVRTYVPELRLADERAAAEITVAQLLNHTAGLDWNLVDASEDAETPRGFVAKMAELPLIAPPGARASYSQAGYNLAGLVIERVTGMPYEKAVAVLILEPLGLSDTVFDLDDVVIRKFAVGHNRDDDGTFSPARPWKSWRAGERANNPGGGAVSSVSDMLRWAQFHLGEGDSVLPAEALRRMQEPTIELRASSMGDALGICWFLREIDGVGAIGHGGSGNGQFAELLIVPERNFAIVSLANAGPEGYNFNQAVVAWALEHYLGVTERAPEPLPFDAARAQEAAGRYEIDAMNLDVVTDGERISLAVGIKPEIRGASDVDMPPDYPAAAIGFLPRDEYVVTEGGLAGQLGFFSRDETGAIVGIDLAGRLFARRH